MDMVHIGVDAHSDKGDPMPSDDAPKVIIGAAALMTCAHGKVLLTKRSRNPRKGFWHLPGGRIEFGEPAREALARELKEELGITARTHGRQADFITEDIIVEEGRHVVCLHFRTHIMHGVPTALDGTDEVGWFSYEEMVALKDVLISTRWALTGILDWPSI